MLGTSPKASFLGLPARVCARGPVAPATSSGRGAAPPRAFANPCAESCNRSPGPHATYERVLRYPDGRERRIRYPVPVEDLGAASEEWQTRNAWKARGPPRAGAAAAQAAPLAPPAPAPAPPEPAPDPQAAPAEAAPPADAIPASPLALLRMLTSESHRAAAARERQELAASYEVLLGCPWPAPRPLFVLAARQEGSEAGLTHTLRTRLPMDDVEDELQRVLRPGSAASASAGADAGGRRKPLIRCARLVDGVVAFESEADAEAYGEALEGSGAAGGVAVARCDSHELFREVQGVSGAVVLLRRGAQVPAPHALAAAVRGPPPALASADFDDEED